MKKLFKVCLFEGLLLIALGIVMLSFPEQSRSVPIIVIGCLMALMGLVRIISVFANKGGGHSFFGILLGLLQIAVGVYIIIKAGSLANLIPLATGIVLAYGALVLLINAFRYYEGGARIMAIIFALLIAALAVIIILNPASFGNFMATLHGIALIIEGIFLIIVGGRVKAID